MALSSSLNALLVISKDDVRARAAVDEALRKLKMNEAPREVFYGGELTTKEISSLETALFSTSLFSTKQIVHLKHADSMKSACVDALLKLPLDRENENLLLLTASALKSNSRLLNSFKKHHHVIDIKPIKGEELAKWTISQAEKYNLSLSRATARMVTEVGEEDPDKIDQALLHLSLYCDGADLSPSDILTLFHRHPDPNEFALLEQAIFQPNEVPSLTTLHELIQSGKNPFLILNLLGKTISRLLSIRVLLEQKKSKSAIQETLQLSPWLLNKQLPLAKKVSSQRLRVLLELTALADSQLKGRSLGDEVVIENFLANASRMT